MIDTASNQPARTLLAIEVNVGGPFVAAPLLSFLFSVPPNIPCRRDRYESIGKVSKKIEVRATLAGDSVAQAETKGEENECLCF